jgi:hypothetical protein
MKNIAAKAFDEKFESGKEIHGILRSGQISAARPGTAADQCGFPPGWLERLDEVARELGVTRQSVIKFWIAERLKA